MSNSDLRSQENNPSTPIDTLTPYLSQYSFGEKIRRLRLKKSMGLVELGKHTGLSAAMLSKLENNHVIPTLQTLSRIAMVFSVGLDHFFVDPALHKSIYVTRSGDRMDFEEKHETKGTLYNFQCLDYPATNRKSSAYLAEFCEAPIGDVPEHTHPGTEFIYLESGTLEIEVDGVLVRLNAGDSAYFDGSLPHGYRKTGTEVCRAVVVTVP
jgi:transcriptional regulator with XRE-family HTH domain